MIIQNVFHKKIRFHAYKIQILHKTKDTGRYTRKEFANWMLNAIEKTTNFKASDVQKSGRLPYEWSRK
jgi:hypothetical protein